MRNKEKVGILVFLVLLFSLSYCGCGSTIPDSTSPIGPTSGWIAIENGSESTKDSSPLLTIYSEGAAYMSFSGNREDWTEWVNYDNSYQEFNIANGLFGTIYGSGEKYVYVRFKDEMGNLSPPNAIAFDIIEYEMGELFSIKILPQEVTILVEGSHLFTLHGYDLVLNEVPLESKRVSWTKTCGGGSLSPLIGLSTTYTAPSLPGERNITAQYNNLKTGATIIIVSDE